MKLKTIQIILFIFYTIILSSSFLYTLFWLNKESDIFTVYYELILFFIIIYGSIFLIFRCLSKKIFKFLTNKTIIFNILNMFNVAISYKNIIIRELIGNKKFLELFEIKNFNNIKEEFNSKLSLKDLKLIKEKEIQTIRSLKPTSCNIEYLNNKIYCFNYPIFLDGDDLTGIITFYYTDENIDILKYFVKQNIDNKNENIKNF